eukprot:gene15866-biopygen7553
MEDFEPEFANPVQTDRSGSSRTRQPYKMLDRPRSAGIPAANTGLVHLRCSSESGPAEGLGNLCQFSKICRQLSWNFSLYTSVPHTAANPRDLSSVHIRQRAADAAPGGSQSPRFTVREPWNRDGGARAGSVGRAEGRRRPPWRGVTFQQPFPRATPPFRDAMGLPPIAPIGCAAAVRRAAGRRAAAARRRRSCLPWACLNVDSDRRVWEEYGRVWEEYGRVWEEYGKSMGRVWEEYGKSMEEYGRVWEEYGRVWKSMEEYGRVGRTRSSKFNSLTA